MMIMKLLFLLLFITCTTSSRMADNQVEKGHYRLYSYPEKLAKDNFDKERYKKIVFVSSNNFEGMIQHKIYPIKNRFNENREIHLGGIAALKAYQDIFKKTFDDKVIFIDAGSFLSEMYDQQKTVFLYNYLNPDVAAIGHSELKNLAALKQFKFELLLDQSKVPLLASNLFDLKNAKNFELKNVRETYIKTIHNLKVGFIATVNQDFADAINDKFTSLYVQNETKTILAKASELRRKGAEIIVLLSTSSIDCNSQIAQMEKIDQSKVNFLPRESKQCDRYNNKLYTVLSELPPNTVDLIITSGSKLKTANFIKNYPVMQNEGEGNFYSWSELYFDTKHNVIDQSMTKIHQPVQLCHHFIKKTQDCFLKENYDDAEITSAYFLGEKVKIKPIPSN